MAKDLAAATGVRPPTTMSQRDETGMSRAIIPLLVRQGVKMISLGAGGEYWGQPTLPPIFVWRDEPSGSDIVFVYDHGYLLLHGRVHVLSNGVGIYCSWNVDNGGPPSASTIEQIYAHIRKMHPDAHVHASTFDDFADAISPEARAQLPVITHEIGDTWLYGNPSDPLKNIHFREISRLRRACIESRGRNARCEPSSLTMRRFDRLLGKIPEHTWGADTTWYLPDNVNWTNAQFERAVHLPHYRLTVQSWVEQRSFLVSAVRVLEASSEGRHASLEATSYYLPLWRSAT